MKKFKDDTIIIFHSDNLPILKKIPSKYIDLTLCSPPYDSMKTYKNTIDIWTFDKFKPIANELFRVTKDGGCVVWIVCDETIKGSETGSSFRQALYFMEIGFNLYDTMIFMKQNPVPSAPQRQTNCFEYMFVLSKGKPTVFNPRVTKPLKIPSRTVNYKYMYPVENNKKHYEFKKRTRKDRKYKLDQNIWQYKIIQDQFNKDHPATFPLELALDHILTWTKKGMRVLDPFLGSGTVGRACVLSERNFIGIEKVEEFYDLAVRNIKIEKKKPRLIKTLDAFLKGEINEN